MDYLNAKNSSGDFVLSDKQIQLLDQRTKTPVEHCMPAEQVIANLKYNKYGV
jgi:hypothetical protein